ncbi:hypothetical protein sos41_09040 [Alphaproteobacteria bacterium SO-S41]|nr:hypothetical protein sos41_09040 [Alphaproteobacteria bacterium SO-S41]
MTQSPNLLRFALAADAVASGATGLLMLAGAGLLAPLLHVPAGHLMMAGVLLVPFVAFVAYTATRAVISRAAAHTIVELNVAWTIASFVLLFSGWIAPNALGIAFIAGQALAVLALGGLQYYALRQSALRTA